MKKIRNLIVIMLSFILIAILNPIGASAEWRRGTDGWNYYENGTLKTGWLLDNDKWYYLNSKGNMLTGWITDNGTWYYMREDGSLDDAKTTTTMPNEIQLTINLIKPFTGGLNIKYAGIGYVKDTDGFSSYGLADKRILFFKAEDEYGKNADFYYVYDPYNCKVYKLFGDLTIKYIGQANMTNSISQEQAKLNVKNYLVENNKYIPGIIEIEPSNDNNNVLIVHCYDNMIDHTATYGWYYVDKSTGNIITMI